MKSTNSITGTPIVQYSVTMALPALETTGTLAAVIDVFQFKLRGNFRKTAVSSELKKDLVQIGGNNAT